MNATIYGLSDPDTGEIRYIGQTTRPLERRLKEHVSDARTLQNYRACWMRSLKRPPKIIPLCECLTSDADGLEIRWIAYARSSGWRLTNLTDGGDGVKDCTGEIRQRISRKLLGRKLSASHVEAAARGNRGKKRSPEWKLYMSDVMCGNTNGKGHVKTPGARLISSILKGGGPVRDDLGNVFVSVREAARHYGIDNSGIRRVLAGTRRTAAGRTFHRVGAEFL